MQKHSDNNNNVLYVFLFGAKVNLWYDSDGQVFDSEYVVGDYDRPTSLDVETVLRLATS